MRRTSLAFALPVLLGGAAWVPACSSSDAEQAAAAGGGGSADGSASDAPDAGDGFAGKGGTDSGSQGGKGGSAGTASGGAAGTSSAGSAGNGGTSAGGSAGNGGTSAGGSAGTGGTTVDASVPDGNGTHVTFVDGFGGDTDTGQDTMLHSGAPTIAFSTHNVYDVSTSRNFLQRFILQGIPAGAACVSATLHYYKASAVPNKAVTCTLYAVSAANGSWIEGPTYGGTAAAGEPCWNARAANGSGGVTAPWAGSAGLSTAGVDYDATGLGSFVIPPNAQTGDEYTCNIDVVTVASWFGQSTNPGLLMKCDGAAEYLGSAEHANTSLRPKLVVEYVSQ